MKMTTIEAIDREAFGLILLLQDQNWSWIIGRALEILEYSKKVNVKVDSYEVYKKLRTDRMTEPLMKITPVNKENPTTYHFEEL